MNPLIDATAFKAGLALVEPGKDYADPPPSTTSVAPVM